MSDDPDVGGKVGFKRPPEATRFKLGQSGNPKGRPRGAKNFASAIQDELATPIVVTENGKRKRITKRAAIAKQLVNKAAGGDSRAIPILLGEDRVREERDAANAVGAGDSGWPSGDDRASAESIIRRIQAAHQFGPERPEDVISPIDPPANPSGLDAPEEHNP